MQHFWRALEQVPGLATVKAEWVSLLGPEYEAMKGFFRPIDKLAQSYPCPLPRGCGCAHAVVEHGPDDIVAVCTCTPRRCEPAKLAKTDIIIYTLDRKALGLAVTDALHFDRKEEVVGGLPMTRRLGSYQPYEGIAFPAYLTIQIEPEDLKHVVEGLVARNDAPFILLAPTGDLCTEVCEGLLRTRKACFLPLAETLVWEDGRGFTAARAVEDILGGLVGTIVPTRELSPSAEFFPTPPGATWEDVQIKFKDGHTVSVKVGEAKRVYTYTQMGMSNSKNGEPTVRWRLLRDFAQQHGTLGWESRGASRKNQKRREKLADDLQAFFRIDGDPICLTKDRKGWQTRFAISPDE